ncbi:hypothetical protein CR513_39930, partial [Mucuna pruriens]
MMEDGMSKQTTTTSNLINRVLQGTPNGFGSSSTNELEKLLDVVPCFEEQKAKNCWRGARGRMVALETLLTWEIFRDYIPKEIFSLHRKAEFVQLQQGSMLVGQYVAKFEELAKFSLYPL